MMYGTEGQRAAVGSDRTEALRGTFGGDSRRAKWEAVELWLDHCARRIGSATSERIDGVNFMTPDVVATRRVGSRLVELSCGREFMGDGWIVGVSVRPDPLGLSCCVHDLGDVPVVLANIEGSYS